MNWKQGIREQADVPKYIKPIIDLFIKELQEGNTDYTGMLVRLSIMIDSQVITEERKRIINLIWSMWTAQPLKRKNNELRRIIDRTAIVDLVAKIVW